MLVDVTPGSECERKAAAARQLLPGGDDEGERTSDVGGRDARSEAARERRARRRREKVRAGAKKERHPARRWREEVRAVAESEREPARWQRVRGTLG